MPVNLPPARAQADGSNWIGADVQEMFTDIDVLQYSGRPGEISGLVQRQMLRALIFEIEHEHVVADEHHTAFAAAVAGLAVFESVDPA